MLTIPTVRVLRSASAADDVVAEAGTLLGCDKLQKGVKELNSRAGQNEQVKIK